MSPLELGNASLPERDSRILTHCRPMNFTTGKKICICQQHMNLRKDVASFGRITRIPLQPICQQNTSFGKEKSRIPLESDSHPFAANMPTAYEFGQEKISHPFGE